MPSITISPCAKLMMRMTPKTIVSPMAIIAYSDPVSTPLTTLWTKVSMATFEDGPRPVRGRGPMTMVSVG